MHFNIMIDNNHNIFCNYQKRNPFTGELDSQEYCLRYDVDTKEIYIEETRKDSLFTDYFYSQLYSNREFAEKEAMRQHIITNKSFLEANNLSDRIVAIDSGSSLCDFFGYIYIMDINDLPKDNAFFEGEFPELLGLANKIAEGYVMIQLPYELSAEDVVKLFSDNCAEISFEGVYIDEHDSIDGLVHYVDSVEEYNEYINTGAATFSYNYDFLIDNK